VNGLRLTLQGWPLRRKVLVLLVVSSLLPIVLVTMVVVQRESSMVRSANVALLQARVDQVGEKIEALHQGFHVGAARTAQDPHIIAFCEAAPEARASAMASVLDRLDVQGGPTEAIRGVGVLDREGTVIAATESALVGSSVAFRSFFQQAIAGASVSSDVYVSVPATGRVPTVALAEPVRSSDQEVIGVLVVWLKAQAIWDVMLASNGATGPGSYFILFDHLGIREGHSLSSRLIFHPAAPLSEADARALVAERRFLEDTPRLLAEVVPYPIEEALREERTVFRRPRSPVSNVDHLAVARRLPAMGATLVAHVPESQVEVGFGTVLRRVLPAFLVGTLLAALGAFVLLRQVVQPVRRLADAAAALERGEELQIEPVAAGDRSSEIARLTEAFRSMARTIVDRERGIRASNQDLRLVLDNVGQGFLAMDAAGVVSQERSAVVDLWLGAPAPGQAIWTYLGRQDEALAESLREAWSGAFAHGQVPDLARLPKRLQRSERTLDLEFRMVEARGRVERVILVITDVSEQLQRRRHELEMEAELRQSQKLESVGRLAAGIAHEINTPLQYVTDSCTFLAEAVADMETLVVTYREVLAGSVVELVPAAEAVLATIAEAEGAADVDYLLEQMPKAVARSLDGLQRVTTIVRAMKEFAHPDQKEMTAVDLNRAIASTLTIARNEYKYVAEVQTTFGALPAVTCHAGEVNQAILNIVVNAAHAIGDVVKGTDRKGTITVRTWAEGQAAVISIADTGGGIPEAIRDRIYDPFFTTKEVGKGTGQGLWISRSVICDKHGGELTFESEPGRGTTFLIRLPIDGRRPDPAPDAG
jgi:signal transduction histidine kinase/HAMP domain-containing protein